MTRMFLKGKEALAIYRRLASRPKVTNDPNAWRSLYEPTIEKPKLPPGYPLLNVRLDCYEYAVLEKYQSYVHKTARKMGFTVAKSWAAPPRSYRCTVFKPHSSTAESVYNLQKYCRVVQLANVAAYRLSTLLDVVAADLPAGVELTVQEHSDEEENYLYIPDLELKETKQMLEEVDSELKK